MCRYRVLVFTAHSTMIEPYAEAPSFEEARKIKNGLKNWVFFGIDYIGEDGIPRLIKA